MRIPNGPDPAAAWRKTMAVITAFRHAAEIRITSSIYASIAAFAMLLLSGSQTPICAAEIRLVSAASIQEVFKEIVGDFERTSGHQMIIHYGTMGTDWMRSGEEAGLVISPAQSIATLLSEGKIEAGNQSRISKVGIGIVVSAGGAVSGIASVEDLSRALLRLRRRQAESAQSKAKP
jgi:ABC-type molybdate transport system substrate-binding protein